MLHGLFLDPRIWKIDYLPSPFWTPEKYGIKIDLHPDAFKIPKMGVDKKYKFVIASEVWEIPMQKTLEYLRNKGLKIFLVPREVAPGKTHEATMFADPHFKYKNQFFCKPDMVLSPGTRYNDMWNGKAKNKIIGYPRFDIYLRPDLWPTKDDLRKKYGIENKKIVYFPSYPPYHIETVGGKSNLVSIYNDLDNTMKALEKYSEKHQDSVQVVVKIHPMAMKCYLKGIGPGREVDGLMEKYYKHPTKYMKVIGDNRLDSSAARHMIMLADLVIGHASMMMLEAVMVDKPVIHLALEQVSKIKDALTFHGDMCTIREPEKIESAIDLGLNTGDMVLKDKSIVERILYKVDGKFCERLCAEINSFVGSNK